MKSPERKICLTELVTEKLRHWIITGDLELGAHLSEARIARQLNVSRTPVREAVNRLEREGLLIVEPQRGTMVFSLSPCDMAQLCDARQSLECTALRAAMNRDAEGLAHSLGGIIDGMKEARADGDDSAFLGLVTRYHQCFFDHSGNRFLDDAYQTIATKMAALRYRIGRHGPQMEQSFREHLELTRAARAGDTERAEALLRLHIDRKEDNYWVRMTSQSSPEAQDLVEPHKIEDGPGTISSSA